MQQNPSSKSIHLALTTIISAQAKLICNNYIHKPEILEYSYYEFRDLVRQNPCRFTKCKITRKMQHVHVQECVLYRVWPEGKGQQSSHPSSKFREIMLIGVCSHCMISNN